MLLLVHVGAVISVIPWTFLGSGCMPLCAVLWPQRMWLSLFEVPASCCLVPIPLSGRRLRGWWGLHHGLLGPCQRSPCHHEFLWLLGTVREWHPSDSWNTSWLILAPKGIHKKSKPSPMWVECCQERNFMRKMYLEECLQSIGLCVHCGSALCWWPCSSVLGSRHTLTSPFMGFMRKLSDDGPWCWIKLLRDDFFFYQVIQFLVYCLLWLNWHLPSGMHCWLDCGVHPDVVGSLQAAKSVECVGV